MLRQVRDQLKQDDAEIAKLERKLGIRRRRSLPREFREDGLDGLVDASYGGEDDHKNVMKQKRKAESKEWLRQKRRKAFSCASGSENEDLLDNERRCIEEHGCDNMGSELSKCDVEDKGSKVILPRRHRENPFVAPALASSITEKYIPPALRQKQLSLGTDSEAVARVCRQAHHLITRLSDANMLTILEGVEKMYCDYPRHYVTDAVVDKLLDQVSIDGALSNSVIILIAGFATALYHVIGIDFGSRFVQQSATIFQLRYDDNAKLEVGSSTKFQGQKRSWTSISKPLLNMMSLLAELYNFRMIGPNLVYDYIRMFLREFTEINTELLLRLFEVSGQRLRQDDSHSLECVVLLIQPAVMYAGGENKLPVRTRHMIQRLRELQKGEKNKARGADKGNSDYAERVWKILRGLINSRHLHATGTIRVGLSDIEQADKRGKWWLVGASWMNENNTNAINEGGVEHHAEKNECKVVSMAAMNDTTDHDHNIDGVLGSWRDAVPDVEDLEQLAREQGMNTYARRSIFVTLQSAVDSIDAHGRLLRLGLNKKDKREIANVLIRCVGSEEFYNNYYALVARRVCITDHRIAWSFRICLWRLFRRLGEPMFGELLDDDAVDTNDESTDVRRLVNTAKIYGYLLAVGCLELDILKCLQLVRLQAKTLMFVEVLVITFFEESYKVSSDISNTSSTTKSKRSNAGDIIWERFRAIGYDKDLCRGLDHVINSLMQQPKVASITQALKRAKKALRYS